MRDQCKANNLPRPWFLNSIPKSGTNLLIQAFSGFPNIRHHPADTFFDPYDYAASFYRLGQLSNGHFGVGHIYYSQEWSRMLRRLQMKQVFLIRDLRDVLVSLVEFIVNKPEYHTMHPLRSYLLEHGSTNLERIHLLMNGIQDDEMHYPDLVSWASSFLGWLYDSNTLVVKYEDLVRNQASRTQTLARMVRYLVDEDLSTRKLREIVQAMEDSIDPSTCGTFRKGVIGDWRTHIPSEDAEAFTKSIHPLLTEFGYED
ncbi:sulfotransferase domain-containing protein [Alicyclobacillus acidiphilus]|uniref:sulfotransferase domain-containing protein n=1 Tax=Alicyclobacillus acidiphilus TaxID=182455 RepID=UPI000831638B|nr:sulfotransferase domain-containing protein [Alicyclobacillus acidiphilus]